MFALIMSVVTSTLISFFMRLGETQIKNNMVMFTGNYLLCVICAWFFMPQKALILPDSGYPFALGLGLLCGVLFLTSFLYLQLNIKSNGVVLAATFMKLGVIVPTIMAMVVFREVPSLIQIAGILLALVAILLMNGKGSSKPANFLMLIFLLIMGGLSDSLANIYDKCGQADLKDHYLFFTFLSALLLSIIIGMIKKQQFTMKDFLWGLLIGLPNYFSSRFLLAALSQIPAIVVYPAYNVAVILVVALLGILFFKERLDGRKKAGFLLIILSVICLNL